MYTISDFELDDKVVPFKKTARQGGTIFTACSMLEGKHCSHLETAIKLDRPFLYVNTIHKDGNFLVLNSFSVLNIKSGNYYNPDDVIKLSDIKEKGMIFIEIMYINDELNEVEYQYLKKTIEKYHLI